MGAPTETAPLAKKDAASTDADSATAKEPNYPMIAVILTVMLGIGFGLAYGSFVLDSKNAEIYASKFTTINDMDLQWVFLALVILGRTLQLVNIVPTGYKNGLKGNIRSNPFFFQTNDDSKTLVVFREEGMLGKYNRSNRSVQHLIENSGGLFASVAAIGWVFPKQVCGIVAAFCAGRIVHQRGYASGYGGHAIGFALSMFSTLALEGLALLAFLKGQGML